MLNLYHVVTPVQEFGVICKSHPGLIFLANQGAKAFDGVFGSDLGPRNDSEKLGETERSAINFGRSFGIGWMRRTCMDCQVASRLGPAEMQVGLLPSTFKDEEYTTKDKVRKANMLSA